MNIHKDTNPTNGKTANVDLLIEETGICMQDERTVYEEQKC